MGKAALSAAHSTGFYNEERPCGRGEELTLFVEKNALRLWRRLRWGELLYDWGLLYDTPTLAAHPGRKEKNSLRSLRS